MTPIALYPSDRSLKKFAGVGGLPIYIMPGHQGYSDILSWLGKHKIGKACLYVTKLAAMCWKS